MIKHIAIILDGNRRFAKNLGLPSKYGHYKGVEKAEEILSWALESDIKYLSYFLFSKDNWKREDTEINDIFGILKNFSREKAEKIANLGIKVNILGDIAELPEDLNKILSELVEKTKKNDKLTLNLCINYSGKWDILQAIQAMLADENTPSIELTKEKKEKEEKFAKFLQTKDTPEPDILIRTGGDMRISNFFLWQMAYTELFFVKNFFPDMTKEEFLSIIEEFKTRNRRFGGGK